MRQEQEFLISIYLLEATLSPLTFCSDPCHEGQCCKNMHLKLRELRLAKLLQKSELKNHKYMNVKSCLYVEKIISLGT